MQLSLSQALRLIRECKQGHEQFALVCSFEPLHLETFLRAHLAIACPGSAPEVLTFGFDLLREGLEFTSGVGSSSPALLALQWEDLHPALSWRSRSEFKCSLDELDASVARLKSQLEDWALRRDAHLTYIALPPSAWLPELDPAPFPFRGPVRGRAEHAIAEIADLLINQGARVFSIEPADLDFRNLLSLGSPLKTADAERLARAVVESMFVPQTRLKAVTVDLDNTLWKGIIGEDGPQGVVCGPDERGYPFFVWQKYLKKLKEEGVFLSFCSKNSESDVLPIFDSLGFPLKLNDFSSYRCNWDSKSENIQAIAQDLNIGLDSMLYIDDNPAELAQIGLALPGLKTMRTPETSSEWLTLIRQLHSLTASFHISEEDRLRTSAIKSNAARLPHISKTGDFRHLKELGLIIEVRTNGFAMRRSLELINKTNQFNLTGERLSEARWAELSHTSGCFCCTAALKDGFGDFGVIAVLLVGVAGKKLSVESFVLSCRAFGRCVEYLLLSAVAAALGIDAIQGNFRRTGRNEPAERYLADIGAVWHSEFQWEISAESLRLRAKECEAEAGIKMNVILERGDGGVLV